MNLGLHGYGDEDDEDDEDPGEYQEYEYEPVVLLVTAYRRNARCRRALSAASLARACALAVARAWARAVARACALAVAWAWARAVALAVLWAVARAVAAAFRDARDRGGPLVTRPDIMRRHE